MTEPAADHERGAENLEGESLQCDLVMKGGITSGIVYPGAVVELSKRYRFRSIGGASAGAIAAALVAAAQFSGDRSGFAELARVPETLGATVDGEPFLLSLFRPDKETKPLFKSGLAFMQSPWRGIAALLRRFPRFPVLAAVLVVVAVVLGLTGNARWPVVIGVCAVAPWVLLIGIAADVLRSFSGLAKNDFGMCRLGPAEGGVQPLTVWLHELVQKTGGSDAEPLEKPLTFGDLWGLEPLAEDATDEQRRMFGERRSRLSWDMSERVIDLQVVTTNLTNGRPMRLPVARDRYTGSAEDGGDLYFDKEEWGRFFPEEIVKHLVDCARADEPDRREKIRSLEPDLTLVPLATGAELPVIVAARMSLSFPILISTVPLYRVLYLNNEPYAVRRVVFSDGGISSNFPVHFFDSPLPTRPTFAINLTGFAEGEHPDPDRPEQSVRDPAPATGKAVEGWKTLRSMGDFAVAIKDAMQNWRDNTQAQLPGFRERIIHIKLDRGEGGLNLAMKEEKITELSNRGKEAGIRLVTLFSGSPAAPAQPTSWWDEHRFTRFRVVMSVLEQHLRLLKKAYTEQPDAVSKPYAERIREGPMRPYSLKTQPRLKYAADTIDTYVGLANEREDLSLVEGQPHPAAALRALPPV